MREVECVPFRLTEVTEIFSIRIDGKRNTELQEFLIGFKDVQNKDLRKDFEQILKSLAEIADNGAKESFFRPEGKIIDRLCAIPIYTASRKTRQNGTLRLYCIRVSNDLLIVGGGGLKTTQTYEENEVLASHVMTLQRIDKELSRLENQGMELQKEIYNLIIHID